MIKSVIRNLMSWRPIGEPVCRALVWSGHRGAASRVFKLCRARGPGVVRFDFPRSNGDRRIHLSNRPVVDYVARRVWLTGWEGFERPLPQLLVAAARRSKCVLDVGANTGFYSILMAESAGRDAIVVAFEPLPQALNVLRRNIELNRLESRIRVVNQAVSDAVGVARFYVPAEQYSVIESSASLNPNFREAHSEVFEVKTTTVDMLSGDLGVKVGLLKIDVESQEHRVLMGAQQVLARDRPLVILEVLPTADVATIESIRLKHGYDVYRVTRSVLHRAEQLVASDASPNQVLCPAERTDDLRDIAHDAGLTLSTDLSTLDRAQR